MIKTKHIEVQSQGYTDIIDITGELKRIISGCGMKNGVVTLFVPGSTGGLTTIEYEPGLIKDIPQRLEIIAPVKDKYHHHDTWHDDNGSAHVRAALIGPSLSVPFVNGSLSLGTWQQVVFMDFDTRPRSRQLVVQIMGE